MTTESNITQPPGEAKAPAPAFTAAQMGAALGMKRQSVQWHLKDVASAAVRIVNGNESAAWTVNQIPTALRERLAVSATQQHCRTIEALLSMPRKQCPLAKRELSAGTGYRPYPPTRWGLALRSGASAPTTSPLQRPARPKAEDDGEKVSPRLRRMTTDAPLGATATGHAAARTASLEGASPPCDGGAVTLTTRPSERIRLIEHVRPCSITAGGCLQANA